MLVPALVAVSAVGLGLLLGLAPAGAGRVVGPLRTFALTTALTVAGAHLLPEALHELGALGLAVFALGLSLPSILRLVRHLRAQGVRPGPDAALEFGYAGLFVHHVADGLGLGAYGGSSGELELDVLLALAVHTVPLVAVVTLAYRMASGTRSAIWRSAGLAGASLVGIVASVSVSSEHAHELEAWVAAGVAGLLVHVVTHDLERDLPSAAPSRAFDLGAGLAGVAVSLAFAHGEPLGILAGGTRVLEIVYYVAPPLLIGLALAAALDRWLVMAPGSTSFSLRRSLPLRGHPEHLRALQPRGGYAELVLALALGFDALLIGLWLAGPIAEALRVLGVLVLALGVARLLPGGPRAATAPVPERAAGQGFFSLFFDAMARMSPWLVTGLLLAAVLDAGLGPRALAPETGPWVCIAIVVVLALPVQVESVAAAPVLAALVHRGLPVGAAVAAWVVIAAPGERGLRVLCEGNSRKVGLLLGATAVAGMSLGCAIEFFAVRWAPLASAEPTLALGPPAALVFVAVAVHAIWRRGLRGWLGGVLSHDHG